MVSSTDNFRKQLGPRSNLFDTNMLFLKGFLKKLILKKNRQTTKKKYEKFPKMQRVNNLEKDPPEIDKTYKI